MSHTELFTLRYYRFAYTLVYLFALIIFGSVIEHTDSSLVVMFIGLPVLFVSCVLFTQELKHSYGYDTLVNFMVFNIYTHVLFYWFGLSTELIAVSFFVCIGAIWLWRKSSYS